MAVSVGFSCGCVAKIAESKTGGDPPSCVLHPHAVVARVVTRPPSIVGTAHGPHVKTQVMDPATPTLTEAGHGPLVLKTPKAGDKADG